MSDSTTKQILIDIQLKSDQLKTDVVSLNSTLDQLLVKQLQLKSSGKQNTVQYVELASEIRNTRAEIRNANKDIDNTSKALNLQSGSLKQNQALVSLMRAEWDKLSPSQQKASASTIAFGNKIKELTATINQQKQAVGDNTSNIGNYAADILRAIPGMGSYAGAITNATNAFNMMGKASKTAAAGESEVAEGAGAAEAGISGMSGTMVGLVAAAAAVVTIIGAVIKHFAELTPNADVLAQRLDYVKGAYRAFMDDLGTGTGFGKLIDDMKKAGQEAANLKASLQDLQRAKAQDMVDDARADAQIAELQLKMRNRRNTPEQEKKYFDEIQRVSEDKYKGNLALAQKDYDLAVRRATNSNRFSQEEKDKLKKDGIEFAIILDKNKGLINGQEDLAEIVRTQQAIIATEREKQMVQERSQNRLDAVNMRNEQAQEKDAQKQDEIKSKIADINSQRVASITHMLEFQQESFGKEISSTNEHYRQLIFKQQQYITDAEKIRADKKSSPKTRALAGKEIGAATRTIKQIRAEQFAESQKLLVDHNRSMIDIVNKGALDLRNAQIANINDSQKRELAGIDNSYAEKKLELAKKNAEYQQNINQLKTEIAAKQGEPKTEIQQNELQALKTTYNAQIALLEQNSDVATANEKAKQKAIDATNKKYLDQANAIKDSSAILDAEAKKGITGGKDNPFNSDLQNAKQQQLLDQFNAEVTQAGLTEEAKLNIEKQYLAKSKELKDQNAKEKQAIEIQGASIIANAGLSIIGNANKAAAQAAQVQLNKNKETELANTSLTSAQKLAINNKYRILEGQAKVKEFRTEQKLSLAKAAIAGAEAIIKALPNPFLIALAAATTAAELGVIASQQPPAFAKGGTFKSDGKGAVLPGYSRKDNVNAQLRSGEAVIVSEAVQNPYARSILSGINEAFGGRSFSEVNPGRGYAIGGIVTDGNNSNRYYAQPQLGTENLANTIAYSLINNFPPIFTDVKDINSQQGILNKTTNRVSI